MHEVAVIEESATALAALGPIRARLLAALAEPESAATLAEKVGLTRQKVNYHLRALESHGLVREVDTRRWGGLHERVLVATAASYVVSPGVFGAVGADPSRSSDRSSARYLVSLGARLVREVGALLRRADTERKRVATLAIDTELKFASARERRAFADELATAVTGLVSRYHDESAPDSRSYRLVVAAHPRPAPEVSITASEATDHE